MHNPANIQKMHRQQHAMTNTKVQIVAGDAIWYCKKAANVRRHSVDRRINTHCKKNTPIRYIAGIITAAFALRCR